MKKVIFGLAAGAMALGASITPVHAGLPTGGGWELPWEEVGGSIWDYLEDESNGYETVQQLVLLAGLANTLDACGNGKALYTAFLPDDNVMAEVLGDDGLDTTVAALAATPAVVLGILNDHIVNGAVDPYMLTNAGVKKLVARSGYVINVRNLNSLVSDYSGPAAQIWSDWYVNGQQIVDATATCNGWIYGIFGIFDPTEFVETLGQNNTPNASGSGSLPDTL